MAEYDHIAVEPISTALGAVIHGVDCASELPQSIIEEVRAAWLKHLVVFFPDQQ
jgi:taurine dioxygenase